MLVNYEIIYDGNDGAIANSHFQDLMDAQKEYQLHLSTTFRKRHVQWHQEEMRVKLIAQTSSHNNAIAYSSILE